jgi:hypothetical protein
MESIEQRISKRIEAEGRGWCFTPQTFSELGSPEAVRVALHRLVKRGQVRRLSRGLYDFPKEHPRIGTLAPRPDAIADAVVQRDAIRVQASGAYAANLLGLTEQVPAKIILLTDGPTRHVQIGRQEVVLKRTTPRNMATAGKISGTVIQALRHLGAKQISAEQIAYLRQLLTARDKQEIARDRSSAPGWMRRILDEITKDTDA